MISFIEKTLYGIKKIATLLDFTINKYSDYKLSPLLSCLSPEYKELEQDLNYMLDNRTNFIKAWDNFSETETLIEKLQIQKKNLITQLLSTNDRFFSLEAVNDFQNSNFYDQSSLLNEFNLIINSKLFKNTDRNLKIQLKEKISKLSIFSKDSPNYVHKNELLNELHEELHNIELDSGIYNLYCQFYHIVAKNNSIIFEKVALKNTNRALRNSLQIKINNVHVAAIQIPIIYALKNFIDIVSSHTRRFAKFTKDLNNQFLQILFTHWHERETYRFTQISY
jgi:hypothetical protein